MTRYCRQGPEGSNDNGSGIPRKTSTKKRPDETADWGAPNLMQKRSSRGALPNRASLRWGKTARIRHLAITSLGNGGDRRPSSISPCEKEKSKT